jgi:hypothetical protein
MISFDIDRAIVHLEHKRATMIVDASLLADLRPQQASLYQFIGEVTSTHPMTVKARVVRNIDGIDTDLHDKALVRDNSELSNSYPGV